MWSMTVTNPQYDISGPVVVERFLARTTLTVTLIFAA